MSRILRAIVVLFLGLVLGLAWGPAWSSAATEAKPVASVPVFPRTPPPFGVDSVQSPLAFGDGLVWVETRREGPRVRMWSPAQGVRTVLIMPPAASLAGAADVSEAIRLDQSRGQLLVHRTTDYVISGHDMNYQRLREASYVGAPESMRLVDHCEATACACDLNSLVPPPVDLDSGHLATVRCAPGPGATVLIRDVNGEQPGRQLSVPTPSTSLKDVQLKGPYLSITSYGREGPETSVYTWAAGSVVYGPIRGEGYLDSDGSFVAWNGAVLSGSRVAWYSPASPTAHPLPFEGLGLVGFAGGRVLLHEDRPLGSQARLLIGDLSGSAPRPLTGFLPSPVAGTLSDDGVAVGTERHCGVQDLFRLDPAGGQQLPDMNSSCAPAQLVGASPRNVDPRRPLRFELRCRAACRGWITLRIRTPRHVELSGGVDNPENGLLLPSVTFAERTFDLRAGRSLLMSHRLTYADRVRLSLVTGFAVQASTITTDATGQLASAAISGQRVAPKPAATYCGLIHPPGAMPRVVADLLDGSTRCPSARALLRASYGSRTLPRGWHCRTVGAARVCDRRLTRHAAVSQTIAAASQTAEAPYVPVPG